MTYNFDADRWFELQRQRLLARRQAGALTEEELASALDRLEADVDALLQRLDGSFQVGGPPPTGRPGSTT